MTQIVRLREEAEQDLTDAAFWYDHQRPGLGHEFLDAALSTFQLIAEQSRMYPIMHRDVRRALMPRFPFGVYFRIEKSCIVVLAVMHASRHPQRWQTRS